MIVKFWSDTNERGFMDALGDKFVPAQLDNGNLVVPSDLKDLVEEWGGEVVGDES